MNTKGTLRVKILGCGTSTGVPVPGCGCPVCRSPNPRNSRLRTSAIVRLPGGTITLIDASTDLRAQALQHGIDRIDAVLCTHSHADHILGIDDLRVFNLLTRRRIPLYGTAATLSEIRRIFSYIFEPDPRYEGGLLAQLDSYEITAFSPFTLDGARILPFQLWHGRLEVLGFRIGSFAYATDCKTIPEESYSALRELDVLVLDGLRYEAHRSHMTIPEAIEAAQRIGARKTYLTHMTHSVDYDTVNAQLPNGIELAYDGLEFEATAD